jgi:hypothetical protein
MLCEEKYFISLGVDMNKATILIYIASANSQLEIVKSLLHYDVYMTNINHYYIMMYI